MQINSYTELEKFYLECNENNKTEGVDTDIVDLANLPNGNITV